MKTNIMCLIILRCIGDYEENQKDLEKIISMLQKTGWNVERIALLEDRLHASQNHDPNA